jgi:hypothetical protein
MYNLKEEQISGLEDLLRLKGIINKEDITCLNIKDGQAVKLYTELRSEVSGILQSRASSKALEQNLSKLSEEFFVNQNPLTEDEDTVVSIQSTPPTQQKVIPMRRLGIFKIVASMGVLLYAVNLYYYTTETSNEAIKASFTLDQIAGLRNSGTISISEELYKSKNYDEVLQQLYPDGKVVDGASIVERNLVLGSLFHKRRFEEAILIIESSDNQNNREELIYAKALTYLHNDKVEIAKKTLSDALMDPLLKESVLLMELNKKLNHLSRTLTFH